VPAAVGPSGEFAVSVLASYASNPLVLGTVQSDDQVVATQLMTRIGLAYAFARRFEAGVSMPFYTQSGDTIAPGQLGSPPASGTARGDLTLHLKVSVFARPRVALGLALAGTAPTASDGQFAGSEKVSGRGLVALTLAPSPNVHLHVNGGAVLRTRAAFANIEQKSAAAGGVGISLRMTGSLTLTGEVFGTRTAGGYHSAPAPGETMGPSEALTTIEALASARVQLGRSLSLTVGGGRGVTSSIGSPDLRGVVVVAFTPTARAVAPRRADPRLASGDPTERDVDLDRVPDAADRCPSDPEDRDRFEDDDGCPDLDNDKDGVADATDACPEAEDKDSFEDSDGCPDPDNDKDGVADAKDGCPNEAETINGMADNDGCPDTGAPLVMSTPERLELVESIAFRGAAITDASTNVLSQLGATLRARTDILRIRITAHVQPSGSRRADQKLSERRAAAVKRWLDNFGIDPARLDVRGMGGTNPLVKPSSKGAAQVNDRVEFIIIDRS
jgi:outer membrane protein OmpA-like peptidoglycan-associated protein